MSNKKKEKTMKPTAKRGFVPKLRFPEFRDAEGWKETQLQKIARPVSDRAVTGDGDNVLSLSGEHGLVLQSDYFGKKIAGDSAERYLKLVRNDFVYNDRTTKASIFGTIKRLSKYSGGIVSPIYKCFRFHSDENPVFWERYFESGSHEAQLGSLVNEGARAGRFNISITQFLSTSVWRPDEIEQQKIADCLSSLDELITAEAQKLDTFKAHKKGLMQQLFPTEGETLPKLRFPEFQDEGDWEAKKLSNVAKIVMGSSPKSECYNHSQIGLPLLQGNADIQNRLSAPRIFTSEITKECTIGDILLSVRAPVGTVAKSTHHACIGRGIAAIRSNPPNSQEFIYQWLLSFEIQWAGISQGGTFDAVNSDDLREAPLAIPSFGEQQKIADCLSSLDELITAETQKLDALKAHKKGLMQQLFPTLEAVTE